MNALPKGPLRRPASLIGSAHCGDEFPPACGVADRYLHATPLGPLRSIWTDRGLHTLRFLDSQEDNEGQAAHGLDDALPGVIELEQRLREYFRTGRDDFGDVPVDERGWTEFARAIYRHCRRIPFGETMTYGQLADRAGRPAASRAVGAAMARNRILLVIPCHRVVGGDGRLRGFSAPGGLRTKRSLLDLESR